MYDLLLIPHPLALAGARFLAAGVNVERDAAVGSTQCQVEAARNLGILSSVGPSLGCFFFIFTLW